jgi:hypothetical protein
MDMEGSLSHTRWECNYHVVFIHGGRLDACAAPEWPRPTDPGHASEPAGQPYRFA